jgi:tRNA pseudouridine38-40 synthase
MPNYRIDLEYEGTRYRGWQEQQNARSVAGELRRALADAGADIAELGGAGRTDAGVHALHQVAHLRLRRAVNPEKLRLTANDRLPADIHLLSLVRAPEKFHARHDAVMRSYLYQISRRRTAMAKRGVWWVKRPLDVRAIVEAAALLSGMHDFRNFCERPQDHTSTKVVVESVVVVESGALLLVRVAASHFLWKMVRRLVGTLVEIGAGSVPVRILEQLLDRAAPASAAPALWTAPPSGLFLERVLYAGDGGLPPVSPAMPVTDET